MLCILANYVKIWKLLLLIHCLALVSLYIFFMELPKVAHVYTQESPAPLGMTVMWIATYLLNASLVTLNATLLMKSIVSCKLSRGFFLGVAAFVTSCSILLIDGLGGTVSEFDKTAPYLIPMASESLAIVTTLILVTCY